MHLATRSKYSLCSAALASLIYLFAFASLPARAGDPRHYTVTEDGAWCWFSDPRAVLVDGQLFAGWMTSDGSVQIGAWDPQEPEKPARTATLAPQFERDDHDHPSLLELPDQRLAAFYAPHAWGDLHMRVTKEPGSIKFWSADRTLGFDAFGGGPRGVTYANPILLREEGNTIYLFWRGTHFKPSFATSTDLGKTWSEPSTLIAEPGTGHGVRPYVKYSSDGHSRIDFLFTDGHPRDEAENSVYYLRYQDGVFTKADGTRVGGLDDLPFSPDQCDKVYDGAAGGRAWVWDVETDSDGDPVIAYTRHPTEQDHRYHYARWNGSSWDDHEITPGGKWFPETPEGKVEPEPHYSGGLSLDPIDPTHVYTSRPIDGIFEIERWTTVDGGASWTSEAITRASEHNNVRPFVVRAALDSPAIVVWMNNHGGYRHYLDYHTRLRCALISP